MKIKKYIVKPLTAAQMKLYLPKLTKKEQARIDRLVEELLPKGNKP